MNRGSILHEDLTYAMLHEMVMKKFKLEPIYPLNLSAKVSSIDDNFDITDDHEVQFFIECACHSEDEVAHLYVSQHKTLYDTTSNLENHQENTFYNFFEQTTLEYIGPSNNIKNTSFDKNGLELNFGTSDFQNNESNHQNESHFEKPKCSFAFGHYNEYEDEKNEFNDVVDDNPQTNYQKWQKYMSFKPDIPETPLFKSKPLISKDYQKDYKKETEVKVGNIFDNKEALDLAIRLKALNEGYQFLNDRSTPQRYALKCFHFNECEWKIRATRWGKTKKFSITFFNDVHTCPKTQTYTNHRNANKKVIAHILTPKLQDTKRVLKGKDIQQDIMSEYKINLSYQQAWRGKDYCIQQIRGSPYESFEMLPYYCYNLERKNEGTVTRIKTDEQGVFEMLFIALGASIRTFVNYLRPLVIIDAAHLKGLYKGTNLMAVGMDGNNQIVPIAFGICKGETGPCWSWWKSVLKECIGDNPSLLFISDRHAAIALAVQNEFPLAYHADIKPDAYDKLCQFGPQRWSRAHCPLVRYNYLTSNSVESVNACTVVYRKLPVLKLAEMYHAMVQEWYYKRRKLAGLVSLADALQDRNMLLTYAQSHQNRLHVLKKIRKGKSPLQLIDEDEPTQPKPEPEHQGEGEGEEYDVERAIQISLESFQAQGQAHVGGVAIRKLVAEATRPLPVAEGKGKAIATDKQAAQSLLALHTPKRRSTMDQFIFQRQTPATKEASTGPFAQPHDDTSANIVCDTPSPADTKTGADTDKTNSGEEKKTEIDEGQGGSDPDKTLETRPPPDGDKMNEDQAGPDHGESRVAL
ncbi:transposase, MuDR, MULE transposase domain protein, partial [Tanacetum coccineum]